MAAPIAPSGRRRENPRTTDTQPGRRATVTTSDGTSIAGVIAMAYRYRIRGSIQAYIRSITKLTTMKIAATSSTRAWVKV